MYRLFLKMTLVLLALVAVRQVYAETASSSIYQDVEQSVYQVRVISKQGGEKTAIGSGFVVMEPNIIATNYHVVSTFVNDPDEFELDYRSTSGKTGNLELLAVDVIHDLAVLRADEPLGQPLQLTGVPPKGTSLYALGNPLDLGFIIIDGTNNGVLKSTDDNNILFSGSLNPGMSGGPTVNEQRQVVGINVATSGNEISFLVPARYLGVILERLKLTGFNADTNISERIAEQLLSNTRKYMDRLLAAKWTSRSVGKFSVPGGIDGFTRCWDEINKPDEDDLMRTRGTRCTNDTSIYLDDGLEVGEVTYEYYWFNGEKMIAPRFYQAYEDQNASYASSKAGKNDVGNFDCYTGFTRVSEQEFKMTVCRRDYYNYSGLSDVMVTAALVGHPQQGMLFNLDMTGVDFDSGMKLLRRMLEAFKWQK